MAVCKGPNCRASIVFKTRADNGRVVPLNAMPRLEHAGQKRGRWRVVGDEARPVPYAPANDDELVGRAQEPLFIQHHLTCPDARSFRKPKAGARG